MKDGVRIINYSRADLVNSADILAAIKDGKVAAYTTDFATDDILGEDGVIATPHLGASTPESEDNCLMFLWHAQVRKEFVSYIKIFRTFFLL